MNKPFRLIASIDKVSEGGSFSQKDVKAVAKSHGLECQVGADWSPYVGKFGVALKTENKAEIHKFLRAVGL
jgi:hypothetical protein